MAAALIGGRLDKESRVEREKEQLLLSHPGTPAQAPAMSPPVSVALIGVGLVGKQVVHQLSSPSFSRLFRIVSLSNSKHTVSISPSTSHLPVDELLALLPPSSEALPTTARPGITYSSLSPPDLVKQLATNAKQSKSPAVLIDCTADLAVTNVYPAAIASGLSVVTPNKKGFSSGEQLWKDILSAQEAPGSGFVYLESTVGAGLPVISTLRDLVKTGDEVHKIEGVFSGTLSYIFNEFSKPGGGVAPKFSEIVKIAKDNGYTEPHPGDDLSGSDVARKLTILSRLLSISPSSLPSLPSLDEGYASLPTETLIPSALSSIANGEDFTSRLPEFDNEFEKLRSDAEKEGKVLRYVGVIDRSSGTVKCGLEKYPFSHPFAASLSGADNIISFHTARYTNSPLIVQGAGAGAALTAMGVVADTIRVAERLGHRILL